MKFAAVVVLLALAFGVECHVIGYSAHVSPLSYTAHGPFVNGAPLVNTYSAVPVASTYSAGPIVSAYSGAPIVSAYNAAPVISTYSGAPVISAYSGAPVVSAYSAGPVVAAPVVAAEGSYVAQTRGSVHIAPLPGHANSAASVNLEPAPGTL